MSDNGVSSVGDGISSLGFKSTSRGKAMCICVVYMIAYVVCGLAFVCSAVMVTIIPEGGIVAVLVIDVIALIFLIVIHVWYSCRLRDTEIHLDIQTKKLVVKSKRTQLCNCFAANEIVKEFPLDYVRSIDQSAMGLCDMGRQVGVTVQLTTGESYSPPRPYFNPADVGRLQEFLQRYKLGMLGAGGGQRGSFLLPGPYAPSAPLYPGGSSNAPLGYYVPMQTPAQFQMQAQAQAQAQPQAQAQAHALLSQPVPNPASAPAPADDYYTALPRTQQQLPPPIQLAGQYAATAYPLQQQQQQQGVGRGVALPSASQPYGYYGPVGAGAGVGQGQGVRTSLLANGEDF